MKRSSRPRPERAGNCVAFDPRAVLPLTLADLRAQLAREIATGTATAAAVIAFNELVEALGERATTWHSRRYRVSDLSN